MVWTYKKYGLLPHVVLFSSLLALFVVAQNQSTQPFPAVTNAQESCTGGTGQGSSLSGIYGWAWSDNIGWICFGTSYCPSSGVYIDSSLNLSGYGWSDNVGWIQFGGLSTASMPSGSGTQTVNARINSGELQGWVQALAASGGWDGWVSLGGTGYGVDLSGGQSIAGPLSGYAWGSDVIGWIDFAQASAIAQGPIGFGFDPSFTASPTRIRPGNSVLLSWSATCMASCEVRDHTGALVPGSSVTEATNLQTPPLSEETTYVLTCYDSNGGPSNDTIHVGLVPYVEEI